MNEENVMRMPGTNNHRRQSVAGKGPRQPEGGVHKRNDHEYAMKKTFIGGALALPVLAYPAHASAQQAASADKAEQSHKQIAEASFMAENEAAMGKMTAALGQPLTEATSSATQSGHASQDGAPPARNAAR
jgi:hypothetical protein